MRKRQGYVRKAIGLGAAGVLVAMALSTVAFGASGATDSAAKVGGQSASAAAGQPSGKAKAASPAWSVDADCTSCHVNEEKAFDDEKCLAAKHAALECTVCHTDEKGLAKGHKKAKEGVAEVKRLKKSEVGKDVCLTCHKQEDLASATAKLDVLTDKEGTTVNPHEVPDVPEHEGVSCASCHYMHRDKTAPEAAPAVCDGCHHDGVYKCFTCHA